MVRKFDSTCSLISIKRNEMSSKINEESKEFIECVHEYREIPKQISKYKSSYNLSQYSSYDDKYSNIDMSHTPTKYHETNPLDQHLLRHSPKKYGSNKKLTTPIMPEVIEEEKSNLRTANSANENNL